MNGKTYKIWIKFEIFSFFYMFSLAPTHILQPAMYIQQKKSIMDNCFELDRSVWVWRQQHRRGKWVVESSDVINIWQIVRFVRKLNRRKKNFLSYVCLPYVRQCGQIIFHRNTRNIFMKTSDIHFTCPSDVWGCWQWTQFDFARHLILRPSSHWIFSYLFHFFFCAQKAS